MKGAFGRPTPASTTRPNPATAKKPACRPTWQKNGPLTSLCAQHETGDGGLQMLVAVFTAPHYS